MDELWKSIDNRYSISNLGRVKSNYANKERVLKPFINHDGYSMVDIRTLDKTVSVHRLVALAFIPNPDNLPEVNHKDENKQNNCVDNLEWCTTKYNCNYGTRNKKKAENCQKPIFSVDTNGYTEYYISIKEASRKTGINTTSISKVLNQNSANKNAKGLLWFYDNNKNRKMVKENNIKAVLNTKKIYSIDENGFMKHYNSISEARRETGINNISRSLKDGKKSGNRNWYYEK